MEEMTSESRNFSWLSSSVSASARSRARSSSCSASCRAVTSRSTRKNLVTPASVTGWTSMAVQ